MEVSLHYCSQNGGNLYNRNPNIGPRIDSNLGQSAYIGDVGISSVKGFCG